MTKKIFYIFILLFALVSFTQVHAADSGKQLPGRLTYAKEWVNLNLLTWKNDSKILALDKYANQRASDVSAAVDLSSGQVSDLSQRYATMGNKISQIMSTKKIADKAALADVLATDTLAQQKILSEARQKTTDENQGKIIAQIQQDAVNQVKNLISDAKDKDTADDFVDKTVATWRDPEGTIKDEKTTRVYAAGTTATGNSGNDGVIIDNGAAKISQGTDGKLKIEYAPGTGPSSVSTTEGKKIWKIQMGDGTVVESYTAGGRVVVGGSGQTAGNIVVNTVDGGTGGPANVVVGNAGKSEAVKVMGGVPGAKTGKVEVESGGPAGDPAKTEIKTINPAQPTNSLNQTTGSGGGQTVEQAQPAVQR